MESGVVVSLVEALRGTCSVTEYILCSPRGVVAAGHSVSAQSHPPAVLEVGRHFQARRDNNPSSVLHSSSGVSSSKFHELEKPPEASRRRPDQMMNRCS